MTRPHADLRGARILILEDDFYQAMDLQERITIGWGRQDRLCLPRQAARARAAFPSAKLHWFEGSGHFPMWDQPEETVAVILHTIG